MAGVLLTSIASGQVISRLGRYRMFPIAGTAVMSIAMLLLSRLELGTPVWVASIDSLVLGLGLGMVMQVLVLAAQNAVDYRQIGVATSGSTLFRQIGGSIGVALFGTIFANRLHVELASRLPADVRDPEDRQPGHVRHLPPALRQAFEDSFAAALHPVFVVAAAVSMLAFALAWLLREVPLRTASHAGDAIPPPRDESAAREAAA